MNSSLTNLSIAMLTACLLTACGDAPRPTPTQIPPTVRVQPSAPQASRTPIPPPTRRIPRATLPPTISVSDLATFAARLTQLAPIEATRRASLNSVCTASTEDMISPQKNWTICGNGGDFKVVNRDGTSWQFSTQTQFGLEYYGDFRLIHWTADEKFLYFAVMNPLDGPGPITSNAEALFRMDLSNGQVITILGSINNSDPATSQDFYVVSISPTSRRLAYSINAAYSGDTPPQKKLHLLDLQNGQEKIIPIELEYATIGNFIWSENGQQFIYKLYRYDDDFCKYIYSIRLLNLTNSESISFVKNETIDQCANPTSDEFSVITVSANQVILKKGDETWLYNIASQRLTQQNTATPTP